jgi:hypothetical protein
MKKFQMHLAGSSVIVAGLIYTHQDDLTANAIGKITVDIKN